MIERGELSGAARCPVVRVSGEAAREHRIDVVAVEEPLEIRIDGNSVATTMRTPGRDADLALGFLFAEGIIAGPAEVGRVVQSGRGEKGCSNVLEVRSAAGKRIDIERVLAGRRWSTTSSACGVCGRRTIDDLLTRMPRLAPGVRLDWHGACLERAAMSEPVQLFPSARFSDVRAVS